MKKVVYVLLGFLLVMIMVAGVGCTKATPAPAAANQTITGTVTGNPIAGTGTNQTITISTPSGLQVYPINPVASTTFAGQACTLDQLNQYIADNTTYNCTVVENGDQGVVAVYVAGP